MIKKNTSILAIGQNEKQSCITFSTNQSVKNLIYYKGNVSTFKLLYQTVTICRHNPITIAKVV